MSPCHLYVILDQSNAKAFFTLTFCIQRSHAHTCSEQFRDVNYKAGRKVGTSFLLRIGSRQSLPHLTMKHFTSKAFTHLIAFQPVRAQRKWWWWGLLLLSLFWWGNQGIQKRRDNNNSHLWPAVMGPLTPPHSLVADMIIGSISKWENSCTEKLQCVGTTWWMKPEWRGCGSLDMGTMYCISSMGMWSALQTRPGPHC